MVICNCRDKKFCMGNECEHYNPHEFNNEELNLKCTECLICYGTDKKDHRVKCIQYDQ